MSEIKWANRKHRSAEQYWDLQRSAGETRHDGYSAVGEGPGQWAPTT